MGKGGALPCLVLVILTFCCLTLEQVQGHGRLIEPPSRATMWRVGYKSPANYNDNQLFCGGVGVQYKPGIDGKCGVCGDPWNGPREHEKGGKYATGLIVRNYKIGEVIDVSVELTANHKGHFEFRICPDEDVTWSCLNKHLLEVVGTGTTRYAVSSEERKIKLKVRLPKAMKCDACFFQWKYNAGNSWGVAKNGTGCIGCGNQEQFYGCSDIAIGSDDVILATPGPKINWKSSDDDTYTRNKTDSDHGMPWIILLACMSYYLVTIYYSRC